MEIKIIPANNTSQVHAGESKDLKVKTVKRQKGHMETMTCIPDL